MSVTTTRTSDAWHYGQITKTSWTTPSTYVYTGGTSPDFNMARQTFTGETRIDNIGKILSMRIYADTANTSTNGGALYVSSTALAPNAVKTSGKLIGNWATVSGTPAWFSVTNFSSTDLIAGIGSATTWYCYWINNVTASRSLFTPTAHPIWELTYDPGSMWVNVNGSWKMGEPWVNVGGVWKQGELWVNVGGTWKQGQI